MALAAENGYYVVVDDETFDPTGHTQGAWNPGEQHMAPVGGLLVNAMESCDPRPDLQLARVSLDILGFIPLERTRVQARVVRPGRTIELVEATAYVGDRAVVRGTAWRLARVDTTAVAGEHLTDGLAPMPPPTGLADVKAFEGWDGGYIRSLQARTAGVVPGAGRGWLNSQVPLFANREATPTAQFLRLADTANGMAVRQKPHEWMFPNVDLVVHMLRTPRPGWVGFDVRVGFGPTGLGITSTSLFDEDGLVGRVEQSLTVRPVRPV